MLLIYGPAALLLLYFFGGLAIYLLRSNRDQDSEMLARGSTVLLGTFARQFFVWLMSPVLRFLIYANISANVLTGFSLLLSIGAGTAASLGWFGLAGWLFLMSGFFDYFDGRVARQGIGERPSGALLDSVLDRYGEASLFVGLAFYYSGTWILAPVLLALVGAQLVSYVRARGGDLGVDLGRVGMMQRPERVAVLGSALCASPAFAAWFESGANQPVMWAAVVGVSIIALSTHVAALHRLVRGVKVLNTQSANASDDQRQLAPDGSTPADVVDLRDPDLQEAAASASFTAHRPMVLADAREHLG